MPSLRENRYEIDCPWWERWRLARCFSCEARIWTELALNQGGLSSLDSQDPLLCVGVLAVADLPAGV
jgi:hypothetical protein